MKVGGPDSPIYAHQSGESRHHETISSGPTDNLEGTGFASTALPYSVPRRECRSEKGVVTLIGSGREEGENQGRFRESTHHRDCRGGEDPSTGSPPPSPLLNLFLSFKHLYSDFLLQEEGSEVLHLLS